MPYTLFSHFSFHAHSRARSSRKCNYRTHKNVNLARTRKGGEANFSHTKLDSPKRICLGKRGSKVMAEAIYYYFLLCTTPLACRGLMWIENGSPIISPPYKCQKKTVEVACSSSSSPQPISPSPRLECNNFLLLLISKRSQTLTPPTGPTPQTPASKLISFIFWKMINYCFQGKHEKDMKNAQDRQNYLRRSPRTLDVGKTNSKLCNTKHHKRRAETMCSKNACVTAENK